MTTLAALLPASTLEYALAAIPLRKLPLPFAKGKELLPAEVLRLADLLAINPSMDELEEERLFETPAHVRAALRRLVRFEVRGYFEVTNDNIDALRRLLTHSEVYPQQLLVQQEAPAPHLTVVGYHADDIGAVLIRGLQALLTGSARDASAPLVLALPVIERGLRENVLTAARTLLEGQKTPYTLTLDSEQVILSLPTSTLSADTLNSYLIRSAQWQEVGSFTAVAFQEVDFVTEAIIHALTQLTDDARREITNVELIPLPPNRYLVRVAAATQHRDTLLLVVAQVLERYLTPTGELRYIALPLTEASSVFAAVEDLELLASGDRYLCSPFDSSTQRQYALHQGIEGVDALQRCLERYREYLSSGVVQHVLTRTVAATIVPATLHYVARRLARLRRDYLVQLSLYENHVTLRVNDPCLSNVVALYTFLLAAEQDAVAFDPARCAQLYTLEGGLLPAELLVLAPVPVTGVAKKSDLLFTTLSPQAVPSVVELRAMLLRLDSRNDVVYMNYTVNGSQHEVYSLVTTTSVSFEARAPFTTLREDYTRTYRNVLAHVQDKADTAILVAAKAEYELDYASPYEDRITVASIDYKLDTVNEGAYYRCDVVAIQNSPIFPLCWWPSWLLASDPTLLERVARAWRRGRWLTPRGAQLYRCTNLLWPQTSIAPYITQLTPTWWRTVTAAQALSVVSALVPN